MIVIDTNVISELMKPTPSADVLGWFSEQRSSDLFLTAVTEAELRAGAAVMPPSVRRELLISNIDAMIVEDFAGRVLPFDSDAAQNYAVIASSRRSIGRPITFADCQIAAISRSRDAALATRNTKDFEHCGISVVNPWVKGQA